MMLFDDDEVDDTDDNGTSHRHRLHNPGSLADVIESRGISFTCR
jgi:hypothetical protein